MKIDSNNLAVLLELWFNETETPVNIKKHRWSRDPVGILIKAKLTGSGNWKNAPRGNPKAGFRKGFGINQH